MKKIQYIAPEIDVLDVQPQGFIAASTDPYQIDVNNETGIDGEEDEVGIDGGGGLFGTLE